MDDVVKKLMAEVRQEIEDGADVEALCRILPEMFDHAYAQGLEDAQ